MRTIWLLAGLLTLGCGGTERTPDPASSSGVTSDSAVIVLFDGTSLDAWRGYGREDVPGGWHIEDGTLALTPGGDGGDLITRATFGDFELSLEWRVAPGGNSGIFFRVAENARWPYESAPEMQILDDQAHPDGASPETSAGANYGLHAVSRDVVKPAGEWNAVRLVARGPEVEHWLNGVKVVEYELGSPEWRTRVAGTKFSEMPEYGTHATGHLGLQDHGDPVWFRDIRVRRLGGSRVP